MTLLDQHPEIVGKPEEVVDLYTSKQPRCIQLT